MSTNRSPLDYSGGSIANLMRTRRCLWRRRRLYSHHWLRTTASTPWRCHIPAISSLTLLMGWGTLEQHGTGLMRQHAGKRLSSVFPRPLLPPSQLHDRPDAGAARPYRLAHGWKKRKPSPPCCRSHHAQALFSNLHGKTFAATDFRSPHLYAGNASTGMGYLTTGNCWQPFNQHHSRGADTLAYSDFYGHDETVAGMAQIPGRKFIYAYWPTWTRPRTISAPTVRKHTPPRSISARVSISCSNPSPARTRRCLSPPTTASSIPPRAA